MYINANELSPEIKNTGNGCCYKYMCSAKHLKSKFDDSVKISFKRLYKNFSHLFSQIFQTDLIQALK